MTWRRSEVNHLRKTPEQNGNAKRYTVFTKENKDKEADIWFTASFSTEGEVYGWQFERCRDTKVKSLFSEKIAIASHFHPFNILAKMNEHSKFSKLRWAQACQCPISWILTSRVTNLFKSFVIIYLTLPYTCISRLLEPIKRFQNSAYLNECWSHMKRFHQNPQTCFNGFQNRVSRAYPRASVVSCHGEDQTVSGTPDRFRYSECSSTWLFFVIDGCGWETWRSGFESE